MEESYDEHSANVARRKSVPERRNEKPWEAGDVEFGAEKRVVDEELGWEVYERRGLGN